ncbi:hypothetical protein J2W49_000049 [Hydrogenophaga palleronii]|uniref:EcsC family protein n=1 Tax=Hydrogenophaga palleronii TaxID=65655 RepID=A0ABU1WFT7_9BURK|nr:EcsC family protein [Hydrogenophaga palleronii]MDR7148121.1 hypothetical protein [Hydrogenophaga palleronii]
MPAKRKPVTSTAPDGDSEPGLIAKAVLSVMGKVPRSKEQRSQTPLDDARKRANATAAKAALAAGALALPPGVLGWLTILPEMMGVWKMQRQMVADIAALYGKQDTLTPEQVVYCLFQHTAARGVRDLVVRMGQRTVVRRASPLLIRTLSRRIGSKLAQRTLGRGAARWVPIVGAVGVGAYVYYDTAQVASTAMDLFEGVIEVEAEVVDSDD